MAALVTICLVRTYTGRSTSCSVDSASYILVQCSHFIYCYGCMISVVVCWVGWLCLYHLLCQVLRCFLRHILACPQNFKLFKSVASYILTHKVETIFICAGNSLIFKLRCCCIYSI